MNQSENRSQLSRILITAFCILMMILTGASDGSRGVFLPLFTDAFSLSESKATLIIVMSYVGNLIFLFTGGYFLDRMKKKHFLLIVMLIWMSALLCYVFTENYIVLLIAMVFSMGTSSVLSTSINLITPMLFLTPVFFTNFFNFIQGIGISGVQNLGGKAADSGLSTAEREASLVNWHIFNLILLVCAAVGIILLLLAKFPEEKPFDKSSKACGYKVVFKNPATIFLVFICGFYYMAEHGIQNVLTTYGSEYLGYTVEKSALFLSLFFGGITVGRLLFAPIVQKAGIMKSMTVFVTLSGIMYITGILLEQKGIWLLCLSGLAFSIIWPTTVLMIASYFTPDTSGVAVGFITSMATIFDIAFYAFFGKFTEFAGYGISIKILPASMFLFCLSFYGLRLASRKWKKS